MLLYVTVIPLAALGENHLNVYLGFFALEYFACSIIFKPKAKAYDLISVTLFVIWVITAILSVARLGF